MTVWFTSYLIDHLKQHSATYTEVLTNSEGETAEVRIYHDQAFQLLKIGAYKPAPPYVIQFSHLTYTLQTELDQLHSIDRMYVLMVCYATWMYEKTKQEGARRTAKSSVIE